MQVGVLGINFRAANLFLRDAVARGAEGLQGERSLFFHYPTVLLSTCNRTEIYFSGPDLAEIHNALLAFLRSRIPISFEQRLYSFFGADCFAHLSRVVSGLDSAILGESEIQRQVKSAYSEAASILALPSVMHYLFQKGLRIGKKVRGMLSLKRGAPSLYGTLWQLMGASPLKKRILLVGFSEVNRGFATFLERRGMQNITFCTRFPEKIRTTYLLKDRSELDNIGCYDVISFAARAGEYLLKGNVEGTPLIFDLSVPRNVDPALQGEHKLYNIEQVDQMIEERRLAFVHSVKECEELVQQEILRLIRLYRNKRECYALEL